MENIKLACSEVYCILEILGDTYKNKLPNKFLEFIDQNRNSNYSLNIENDSYENLNISKDGLVLISFLNLKYWVEDEEEKKRLIEIYKNNDEKRREELNKYKEKDWLNNSKREINTLENSNDEIQSLDINLQNDFNKEENSNGSEEDKKEQGKELIEIKKESIFDKIKKIIKKFFNKKKE